jgi:predicted secreted hydrolase
VRPGRRAALQAALGAWAMLARAPAGAAGESTAATASPTPAAPAAGDRINPDRINPDRINPDRISPERQLSFPRDHGAHPGARIEWWYATGWLQEPDAGDGARLIGFQLTFFRSRTGLAEQLPGRFAPRQLLFAHAAVSDIGAASQAHRHAQRISRWSGDETLPDVHAARADTRLAIGRWTLARESGVAAPYRALLAAPQAGFTLDLQLQPTQPLLLQGVAGYSRKGPSPTQASHYYSQPQLAVTAQLMLDGQRLSLQGRGWLDHEWSDELLAPGAVGWDWIGINLSDGSVLTAFVLRGADDSPVWAGGSHRPAGGQARNFAPQEVEFTALRRWSSPATGANYPVQWRIRTPVGSFELRALLDAQELDSRASTGTVYWEGLAELLAPDGVRLGLGYLEMTGRGQPLKLGL